jgi:RHS repeat-associated protein
MDTLRRPLVLALLASMIVVGVAGDLRRRAAPVTPSAGQAVHGVFDVPQGEHPAGDRSLAVYRPEATTWPRAASATVDVTASPRRGDGVPVWVQAGAAPARDGDGVSRLAVQVLEHERAVAAGVSGVLFTVTPQGAGTVRLGLDYRGFAQANGGDFGARLRLVALPACALSTPELPACRDRTDLASTNRVAGGDVSAELRLVSGAATVLAATTAGASEGGEARGSFSASSLSPSGTWAGGSSSGAFTYSYPIDVPAAASKLSPQVSLSYSSAAVDGRTAATGAQADWLGDGWSTPESYVEQTFASCADSPGGSPAPVATSDACFAGPVMTLSLNGSATALVWDAGMSVWRPKRDDGSVVTHVTSGGDYWTVTARNGTVYQFGRNRLPGWSSDKPVTNSVNTQPVYAAHPGEPCYNATFSASVCPQQPYRWNLDYVTDVHGNAMAYYYKQDVNNYAAFKGATKRSYVRDSYLDHIDYGFTDGNAYGTPPDRVVFGTGERCVTGPCTPLNASTRANWPDVPYDLICTGSAACVSWSPAFFSTVRLTSITTQQYSTATGKHEPVDTYAFTHTMPPPGDGMPATLWLRTITRTASDLSGGGSAAPIELPPVTFDSVSLANRTDTSNLPGYRRQRIGQIKTETGAVIAPTYELVNPCATPVTVSPAANTTSCYPVSWQPSGYSQPILDWFNKWVVTKVVQTDRPQGQPAIATSYRYTGGAAWHYDDNEVVKAKYRTYGQFRGYGDVQSLTGDGANDPQTQSRTTYHRGMSNNNNAVAVTLTDSAGGTHDDADQLAGQVLETTTYHGDGGPVDASTINAYWVSAATATRARAGLPALTANRVEVAETFARQAVTSTTPTTWRFTQTDNTYDASVSSATFGLLRHSYTHSVPVNPAYDRCVSHTYAPVNAAKNLVGLVAETEVDAVACGGFTAGAKPSVPAAFNALTAPPSVSRPAQVVSYNRTFYDDETFSVTFPQVTAPVKGNPTMVQDARTYSGGAATLQTRGRQTFDANGRMLKAYDANGNLTTTAYTMNSAGLTTGATVTDPLGHATTTTFAPARAVPLTTTDINGVVTTKRFDALGRISAVWQASRSTAQPANYLYTYDLTVSGPLAVTTKKMNDSLGYSTSVVIYDALLRERQTQTVTPQAGRLVSDTFYDSRGWASARYDGWWDPQDLPGTALVSAADLHRQVPSQALYTYDGLGRVVQEVRAKDGLAVSMTTTVFNGDRTTVVPPSGGVVRTTVVDHMGRTVAVDEYSVAPAMAAPPNPFTGIFRVSGGTKTATTYGFDSHGFASVTTGSDGSAWTATLDLLGRATAQTDPDGGDSSSVYDGNGNLVQHTDGRGVTVSYTYDALNRKTGRYAATQAAQAPANRIASWVYDNSDNAVPGMTYPVGRLTTSKSYRGSDVYTKQSRGFTIFGGSKGEQYTIPATEGALAGTYLIQHQYTTNTGLLLKDIYPSKGGLPSETVNHGYSGVLDLPNTLGGLTGYADGTLYDANGRVTQVLIGAQPSTSTLVNTWEPHSGRLEAQHLKRATGIVRDLDDEQYKYDPAGNLIRQISTRLGASTPTETQCFGYDGLARLAEAWTATDNCAVTPTIGNRAMVGDSLGAASAYWTSWTFNAMGDRQTQVQHSTTGGADVTVASTYDGAGAGQPHTLTAAGTSTFGYDAAGNMTSRNAGQGSQTLVWNAAGELAAVNGSTAGDTTFVYDADGVLLLQRDPATTTLYLPAQQHTMNNATQVVTGVRSYQLAGSCMALRTGMAAGAVTFQVMDPHNTPVLYLDSTAQVPTWRQSTPFGGPRGAAGTWPDNRGFLDQPTSSATGLTVIGARSYDPQVGRFVSDDPVLVTGDPQSLNGYAYAANNPTSASDPSGRRHEWDEPWQGPPPPTCIIKMPKLCMTEDDIKENHPKGSDKRAAAGLRKKNLKNTSTLAGIQYAESHGASDCQRSGQGQIICWDVDTPTGKVTTIGDVVLYPHDRKTFNTRQAEQKNKREELAKKYGAWYADNYGPDLLRHEAVHSEQFTRYEMPGDYVNDYLLASAWSFLNYGNAWEGNKFEVEANLYWGAYKNVTDDPPSGWQFLAPCPLNQPDCAPNQTGPGGGTVSI